MTEDQLDLLEHVRKAEFAQWILVKHDWNNVHVSRSCGRVEKFEEDEDAARKFISSRAMEATLRAYHKLAAGEKI